MVMPTTLQVCEVCCYQFNGTEDDLIEHSWNRHGNSPLKIKVTGTGLKVIGLKEDDAQMTPYRTCEMTHTDESEELRALMKENERLINKLASRPLINQLKIQASVTATIYSFIAAGMTTNPTPEGFFSHGYIALVLLCLNLTVWNVVSSVKKMGS